MPRRFTARAALALAFVAALLAPASALARPASLSEVRADVAADGHITACRFATADLRAVRARAAAEPLAFRRALRAAITVQRDGVCANAAGDRGLSPAVAVLLGLLAGLPAGALMLAWWRRRRDPGAAERRGTGYRSALAHRDLRRLLGALAISDSGSWAYNVALLAFVFDRTHSLGWVGAAGLARFVPALIASPYAGLLADRYERVRLMRSSDLVCVVLQLGLLAVAVLDAPVVLALVLSALTSMANMVYNPSVAATLPDVVGERDLAAANALNGTVENLVVIVGPAIGAAVLALASPAVAFAVNALSFAVAALLIGRLSVRSRPADVTEGGTVKIRMQLAVGFRAIGASRAVTVLVAFTALASFVYGTDTVLFIGVSEDKLGTGPEGFGLLLTGLGVGGILVATAVNRLADSSRLALVIVGSLTLYVLPTVALVWVQEPAVAFALEVVRGGATLVVDVLAVIALQRAIDEDVLARVFGIFFALILGAIALGALVAPPLVSLVGLDAALVVMGVGPAVLALIGLPALLALDRAAAAKLAELAPRVAVLERLGIFAAANRATLERLASASQEIAMRAGTAFVTEGEDADALYVLLDGRAEVSVGGEPVRTLGRNTYFGEIGLLERIPRTATVVAETDCRAYRIDGDAFLEALTTTPPTASLLEAVHGRLARTHPTREVTFTAAGGGG